MEKEKREQMFMDNIGLAIDLAGKMYSKRYKVCQAQCIDLQDFKQIAYIGLLKAIDKFDETRGYAFSTYAVPTIRGEIWRFMRNDAHLIRPPRKSKSTTEEECAQIYNSNLKYNVKSIDSTITGKDRDMRLDEIISNDDISSEEFERKIDIIAAINELEEVQRYCIFEYYFYEKTQSEIGKNIGVSQVQVSRIMKKGIENLRKSNRLKEVI